MSEARHNMRAERARVGMTQKQVADAIGVHINSIVKWELGETEPTASKLIGLCQLYECTPEYLLDMTDERTGRAVYSG